MSNNDMMQCVTKKKILFFCTETKSIGKILKSEIFLRSKNKFELFLKQEILIHANIKQFFWFLINNLNNENYMGCISPLYTRRQGQKKLGAHFEHFSVANWPQLSNKC
jgi:hypothetical protein